MMTASKIAPTINLTEARKDFRLYFADLQAEARREGWKPNRDAEWKKFLEESVRLGYAPDDALNWKL